MKKPNDGGPIAPNMIQHIPLGDGFSQITRLESAGGLTIRDWFAGMALQGWLASYEGSAIHPVIYETQLDVANQAYAMADAMLAARERKEDA